MKSIRTLVVILSALALACNEEKEVTPLDSIIRIQIGDYRQKADSGLIVANGITRLKVIASIPAGAAEANRVIKFTTSEGTFDTSSEDKKTATATQASEDGSLLQASAWLTLSTTSGSYTISASISAKPDYRTDTSFHVAALTNENVLSVNTDPATGIKADGITLVRISGKLSNTTEKSVTITTTEGTLLSSEQPKSITVQTGPAGQYQATLQVAAEIKPYIITVKAGNTWLLTRSFTTERAYPEKLAIEPTTLLADTTASTTPIPLTIYLQRESGKVSTGTGVTAKAWQLNDQGQQEEKGRFTGISNLSDSDGKLTLHYHTDTSDFLKNKPITVEVSSRNDNGTTITSAIKLRIK